MELALKILELHAFGRTYTLEHHVANAEASIKLEPAQVAVSVSCEIRTEDTDFSVGVSGDQDAFEYTEANSQFYGQTSAGLDIYKSPICRLFSGSLNIVLGGTPKPSFIFEYILATLNDHDTAD